MSSTLPILEVCVASVADALVAKNGGADRLELNATLELGGLTPSLGLTKEVLSAVDLPVIVMLRPRPGDFCYSPTEARVLLRDAELLLNAGSAGIASGTLRPDGTLDLDFWKQLVLLAAGRQVVFHRGFDELADAETGLRQLIDAGTTRIMTSGMCPTALEGVEQIVKCQAFAAGRLQMLPAGGIGEANVREILRRTGCMEIHGSFSEVVPPKHLGNASMGQRRRTSLPAVQAVRQEMNRCSLFPGGVLQS